MVRAAAKNHASVAVVIDPADYAARARRRRGRRLHPGGSAGDWPPTRSRTRPPTTSRLPPGAATSSSPSPGRWPGYTGFAWERAAVLRYGENPHQRAALYRELGAPGIAHAEQLTARRCPTTTTSTPTPPARRATTTPPAVAIIKHTNPCGIAIVPGRRPGRGRPRPRARLRPGLGVRRRDRREPARSRSRWPSRSPRGVHRGGGRARTSSRRRWRCCPEEERPAAAGAGRPPAVEVRPISGGLLMQTVDRIDAATGDGDPRRGTTRSAGGSRGPADEPLADLAFAWRAVRAVKSNAILLAQAAPASGSGWAR